MKEVKLADRIGCVMSLMEALAEVDYENLPQGTINDSLDAVKSLLKTIYEEVSEQELELALG